jgi:hypothetical protein
MGNGKNLIVDECMLFPWIPAAAVIKIGDCITAYPERISIGRWISTIPPRVFDKTMMFLSEILSLVRL